MSFLPTKIEIFISSDTLWAFIASFMNLIEEIRPDNSTSLFAYIPFLRFGSQEEEEETQNA